MTGGYMGKILWVDLTASRIGEETLGDRTARLYLGGYGLGARLLFDRQKTGVDSLGPANLLGFAAGPLTGTPAISGTRYTVFGKSPLTGTWGDANSGGDFAAYLKFSGFDAVIFSGQADQPVYLLIDNGRAELKDASHLWGKDTYATEDILKAELGEDIAVSCIGPAGEKLALIAGVVHAKGSVAARSGLGAVMGSKKLKAVAVKGSLKVPLADEGQTQELRKRYLAQLGGAVNMMRRFGTTFVTVPSIESGDSPVRNWGGIATRDFPDAKPLAGEEMEVRKYKSVACYHCPVGCETQLKAGAGEYRYQQGTFRPEYETLAMLGPNCGNANLESIIMANDICNRQGIDAISAGAVAAFAMECFENGLLSLSETNGLDLHWGNHRALIALTEKIARREGIGDLLADGVKVAAQKLGRGSDKYAMHVGGQEIPGHNPATSVNVTVTYLANATPARHTQGSEEHHAPGIIPQFDRHFYSGRGEAHKAGVCFQHSLMCSGVCLFVNMAYPHKDVIAEFLRSVTGWDVDTPELVRTGERIANLRQAFNLREGISLADFHLPGRAVGKPPKVEGPVAGVTVDDEVMVKDFLRAMDWDPVTGKPSRQKLSELQLEAEAKLLYPQ